jgi:hypothetical protein
MVASHCLLAGVVLLFAIDVAAAADLNGALRPIPDVGDPFDVKAALSEKMPYRNNACTAYRHAAVILSFPYDSIEERQEAIVRTTAIEFSEKVDTTLAEGWSKADDNLKRWLADGELALEIWRQGTECTEARRRLASEIDRWQMEEDEVPTDLVRLACLKAAQLIGAKRHREAWSWYCAVLRASCHCEMHCGVQGRVAGRAVYRIGADGIRLWSSQPEVTAGDLRHALADVEALHAHSVPLADSLKYDYLAGLRSIDSGKYDPYELPIFGQPLSWLGSDVRARRILNLVYANLLSQADRPRGQRPSMHGALHLFSSGQSSQNHAKVYSDEEIEGKILAFSFDAGAASSFIPSDSAFDEFDQERLRQSVTVLTLALQLYEREHGEFPIELEQLVRCGYLKSVPSDPFWTFAPLRYRREADAPERALLWSVRNSYVDGSGTLDGSVQTGEEEETSFRIAAPKR